MENLQCLIGSDWQGPKIKEMSHYTNILTPPSSSNEDSPLYYVNHSPSSNFSIQSPEHSGTNHVYNYVPVTINNMDCAEFKPCLRITEQPIDKFRFRYKSEMAGTHGSLNGVGSEKSRKQTYPSVELLNFPDKAIIRCSIYQINARETEIKPHAHRLIRKYNREEVDDPHEITVGPEAQNGFEAVFHSMGIIHTAKKNLVGELVRKKTKLKLEEVARQDMSKRKLTTAEEVKIKQEAEEESKTINLNTICLRFEAFYENNEILFPICSPVYTHYINNLKSALTGELKIVRMDHCTSPAKGNREIFILVERVTKKNIRVRFYEVDEQDQEIWEDDGKFSDLDVHHQYAIVFKTPPYRNPDIQQKVRVFIELVRKSDHARSEPKEFTYTPNDSIYKPGQKRPRPSASTSRSYDSSNFGSDELPATIPETIPVLNNITSLDFQDLDLNRAINDNTSEDFEQLFNSIYTTGDLESLYLNTDGPLVQTPVQLIVDKIIKLKIGQHEKTKAKAVFNDINDFFKTNPPLERSQLMLKKHFGTENETNALHIFISDNDIKSIIHILKIINFYKQFNLLNVKNSEGETPLHIAVKCKNENVVKCLLLLHADPSVCDSNGNNALHEACEQKCSINILENLLVANKGDYIDAENNDGNTALLICIENKYVTGIKILLRRGTNVNKKHNNNGFVPLRFAIEQNSLDVIKPLLTSSSLDPFLSDFNGISPLEAGFKNSNLSNDVKDLLNLYIKQKNFKIDIKQESLSDDEMEVDSPVLDESKIENEELEVMYRKVKILPSTGMDKICALLDQSDSFENLASLLELEPMLNSGIFASRQGHSRNLLSYAIGYNKDSLFVIRNFLETLDEKVIVLMMDDMIKEEYYKL